MDKKYLHRYKTRHDEKRVSFSINRTQAEDMVNEVRAMIAHLPQGFTIPTWVELFERLLAEGETQGWSANGGYLS